MRGLRLWIGVLLAASIPDDELPCAKRSVAQIATGVQSAGGSDGWMRTAGAPSERRAV